MSKIRDLRHRNYLRLRYRALFGYTGTILLIIGLLLLTPLAVIPFYPDEITYAPAFMVPAVLLAGTGYLLRRRLIPKTPISLSVQEGMVIVVIVWLTAMVVGAVPFMLADGMNFTLAMFESTSGWTTTGLSVVDVTEAPRIILFHRSFIQLAGGAGFAIIALAAISGPSGAGLSMAEGRGDQLAPHVRQSATLVLQLYIGYIIFGIIALYAVGMNPFDAVNHAFTAVATGGFSTRPESIGYWDSAGVELVIILLMIFGGMNFLTAYTLFTRKFRPFARNGEIRLTAVVIPIACVLLYLVSTRGTYPDMIKDVRVTVFETVSALTGTGFSTVSYLNPRWQDFGWLLLIILMTIGGGSGSTAGGLKQARVYVLYKALKWEFRQAFMPKHTVNEAIIWQGEQAGFLRDAQVRRVALFVFLYLGFYLFGSGMVAAHGFTMGESLFEFASALGTVGLSVGVTAPDEPATLLWTKIIGMFLGRLEFLTVLVGLTKVAIDLREMFPVTLMAKSAQRKVK